MSIIDQQLSGVTLTVHVGWELHEGSPGVYGAKVFLTSGTNSGATNRPLAYPGVKDRQLGEAWYAYAYVDEQISLTSDTALASQVLQSTSEVFAVEETGLITRRFLPDEMGRLVVGSIRDAVLATPLNSYIRAIWRDLVLHEDEFMDDGATTISVDLIRLRSELLQTEIPEKHRVLNLLDLADMFRHLFGASVWHAMYDAGLGESSTIHAFTQALDSRCSTPLTEAQKRLIGKKFLEILQYFIKIPVDDRPFGDRFRDAVIEVESLEKEGLDD